jgi:hypothetical protein
MPTKEQRWRQSSASGGRSVPAGGSAPTEQQQRRGIWRRSSTGEGAAATAGDLRQRWGAVPAGDLRWWRSSNAGASGGRAAAVKEQRR